MQTGEKLVFDFKTSSNSINGIGNNLNINNTIYDMQIIDNNEEIDKKYSQLCKVNHMRVMPLYDQSKVIYQSQNDEYIIDFIIIKTNIIFYIFSNGKVAISSIHQILNSNNEPEMIITQLYIDQISQFTTQSDVKIAFHSKYESIMVYLSTGEVYYLDISEYLSLVQQQQDLKSKVIDSKILQTIHTPSFYQVFGLPIHEKAKKFIIENNMIFFITINGKVFVYQINRGKDNILSMHDIILNLKDESADFIDLHNHLNTFVLLDVHRGVLFYEFNEQNEEFTLREDLKIPIEGGVMVVTQQLNTIVVATQDKTIKEYYIDYNSNDYILNNELPFDQHINFISIEDNYLFVSAQSRNSNFFTPLNVLKTTSHDLEQHQTMIKFGMHNILVKYTQFKDLPRSKKDIDSSSQYTLIGKNSNSKSKKLKGQKEQHNSTAPEFKKSLIFISLIDGNKIEAVPYQYEHESIVCSSQSTQKLLSNVNSKYEYTILYNSTDCQEKDRYYKVEKQQPTSLDIRKSYCSSHGTVTFEIDFSHYEQEEFEIGLVFICFFTLTALLCFRYYKNKKLEKMFALKERMSTENTTQKRKRLNLQYEQLSLLPNPQLKQD